MLDAVVDYMPSPVDVPADQGYSDDRMRPRLSVTASDDEPFAALAFKIATDPFVGTLTFFRVYSGVLNSGDSVYQLGQGQQGAHRPHLLQMHANDREEIKEVHAGDIAAAVGLKDVTTGDTLCDSNSPIILEPMEFPEPVISWPSSPRPRPTRRRWASPCPSLPQEDPTFRVRTDEETGQTIISGMGELHLEIIVDRMLPRVQGRGQCRRPAGRLPRDHPQGGRERRASSSASPAAAASTVTLY